MLCCFLSLYSIAQTVNAEMEERYIFNFKMNPEVLAKHLPGSFLKPQIINNYSVVSFCILKLKHVVVAPLPAFMGYNTISCAYRIGVVDLSMKPESNAVYIVERFTDRKTIASLAPTLLSDEIPIAHTSIEENNGYVFITTTDKNGNIVFKARVQKSPIFKSAFFADTHDFEKFIKAGISSYTPSSREDQITRLDLIKKDNIYTPLEAEILVQNFGDFWSDALLEFDSALHTEGGKYTWKNKGRMKENADPDQQEIVFGKH